MERLLIHVGTICVGLLIAVGLEQIVEHVHQRYELRELHESLNREREANRADIHNDIHDWRWEMAELENDLTVLRYVQQHPHATQGELPGVLVFLQSPVLIESGVWDAAEKKGTVAQMPFEEANRNANSYTFLKVLAEQGLTEYHAFNDAGRFQEGDGDPTHMTSDQLDRNIDLLVVAIEKHVEVGRSLTLIGAVFPELGSDLTNDEVGRAEHLPFLETPGEVAAARRLTVDRLVAAGVSQRFIQSYFTAPAGKQ